MSRNPRKDLSENFTYRQWDRMLSDAEKLMSQNYRFTQNQLDFIREMRRRTNEEAPLWSPSLKQWNWLHDLSNGVV